MVLSNQRTSILISPPALLLGLDRRSTIHLQTERGEEKRKQKVERKTLEPPKPFRNHTFSAGWKPLSLERGEIRHGQKTIITRTANIFTQTGFRAGGVNGAKPQAGRSKALGLATRGCFSASSERGTHSAPDNTIFRVLLFRPCRGASHASNLA